MKTKIKMLAFVISCACILFQTSKVKAQFCGPYGGLSRWELQTTALDPYLAFTVGTGTCGGPGSLTLPGVGINVAAPSYELDILCTSSTNQDVNISCPTCTPSNAVGYRIGGNYVLWHNGDIRNIFVGVGAGNNHTGIYENTFVGGNAGNANYGNYNTATGYGALANNTYASYNTAIGLFALYTQSFPNSNALYTTSNTAVGIYALYSNQPTSASNGYENTAVGASAMNYNKTGSANTAAGIYSLYNNITGNSNTAIGTQALTNDTNGSYNTATGDHALASGKTGSYNTATGWGALEHNIGTYNVADGVSALITNVGGSYNSATGVSSLTQNTIGTYNVANGANAMDNNISGSYNTCLGSYADLANNNLTYATAIGASSKATASNQMELGSNNITITMGLSGIVPTTPVTRLELNTQYGSAPFTYTWFHTAPPNVNFGRGTGWSGLRFDDLKSISTPGKNPGPGYLALDTAGNVIYVDTAFASGGSGTGIGYCGNPCGTGTGLTSMIGSGGYNMNSHNFYFAGNGGGNTAINNVAIGNSCCYIPQAKLDVLQNSGGLKGSMGIYVENDDFSNTTCPSNFVIGIKSKMNTFNPGGTLLPNIAGWFEADIVTNTAAHCNYAIYVPGNSGFPTTSGIVSIGYDPPTCANPYIGQPGGPACALQVATPVYINGLLFSPSDREFKTNITPITNAISKIDSINAIYFYYDTAGFPDREFSSQYQTGFIAQNVDSVFPEAAGYANGYYNIDYSRMTPLLLAGIRQQQQTIDSLRTICNQFESYVSCLNSLCGTGSMEKNDNAKTSFLYQNTPGSANTGTKINYYLPQGTTGATLVFYDTYGNQLKTVQLSQTGNGTLNITPGNLSNGIYSYSLIVNGNVIDTKKIMLQ